MFVDDILNDFKNSRISIEEARKRLSLNWIETVSKNVIDVNRQNRVGIPEIIYGEHKNLEQILDISREKIKQNSNVIISRSKYTEEIYSHFRDSFNVIYGENIIVIGKIPEEKFSILVLSGGSSDRPVVEEIELTLKALGARPLVFEDRGIAHPSRVLECIKKGLMENVRSCIVVAGMEASLATFASSMLPMPVIGVPTSIGYGYKSGESALISMLSSCTPNLAVVNIDGGIRAAVIAYLIGDRI